MTTVFDRLCRRFGIERQHGRKVLVMRAEAHRRWHPAEKDVYQSLPHRGFEAIMPETMSAEAQIAAISSADVLIGFSGSALHNSVFMHPGSTVIEIGDNPARNKVNPIQKDLCRICRQDLRFVPGFGRSIRSENHILRDVMTSI
jgi:capsular polysaccharide biosynthesis protein